MGRRIVALVTSALLVATATIALSAPAASAASVLVTVGDFFFAPATVTIKAGDTVTFRFVGPEPHSATSTDGAFDTGILTDGTHGVRFPDPGTYDYFCVLHPDMQGTVRVLGAAAEKLPAASSTVAQALRWSARLPDGSAPVALLGRSDVFADALASGALQGQFDAPLLLTQRESLNSGTAAEMDRLGVRRVIILGGANAVSSGVAQQLRDRGYGVDRVSGATRIATAVAVAQRYLPRAGTAVLARAFGTSADPTQAFADSLAAGALAAEKGWPVLLTETGTLSADTEAYLGRSAISRVIIAGGTGAVSQAVEDRLTAMGIEVTRSAGADRGETAWALAFEAGFSEGLGALIVVDSTGPDSWAAGLAAAQTAAQLDGSVVPASALGNGTAWTVLIEDRPGVVCGPGVDGSACDRAATAATATAFGDPAARWAFMDGEFAGNPGNPDALPGGVILQRTSDPSAVCWNGILFVEATAAHVHRVSDGSPVIPLAIEVGPFGDPYSCTFGLDAGVVRDVFAHPEDYYVNVHSEAYPEGEIAGQLFTQTFVHQAGATGGQEVPPVDQEGGAYVGLIGDTDRVCAFAFVEGASGPATAMHVHDGAKGTNGPVVVTLPTPMELEEGFSFAFGCGDATTETVDALDANPTLFYVNIHTEAHPDGEFRGQIGPMIVPADETSTARTPSGMMRAMRG